MTLRKVSIAALCLAGWTSGALAMDKPYFSKAPTLNASSTITVTDTFQSVFVAQERAACKIVNTGTNPMWVFFGPMASATKNTSIKMATGVSTTCGEGGVVRVDQVSITGTSGETFYADRQN